MLSHNLYIWDRFWASFFFSVQLLTELQGCWRALNFDHPCSLNFSSIKGKQREAYFAAVRAGMGRDYAPMIEIFRKVVKASS